MLNKDFYPDMTDSPERVEICGSFAPNGSSALVATDFRGNRAWVAAYISTGLFRVTFKADFAFVAAKLVFAEAHAQVTTAQARFAQCGDYVAANRTLDIRTVDGSGVVQDVAANANNRIFFRIVVRDTELLP